MMSRKAASKDHMCHTWIWRRQDRASTGRSNGVASTQARWPELVTGSPQRTLSDAYVSAAAAITVDYVVAKRLFQSFRQFYVFDVSMDLFTDDCLKVLALPEVYFDRWFTGFALRHVQSPSVIKSIWKI